MQNNFKKSIYFFGISIFAIIFISSIYIPIISNNNINNLDTDYIFIGTLNSQFCWPAPGYTRITSKFGYRNAPTLGASTYHSGIDIAAPTGSNLIACIDGQITYLGFKGAGGYTITLQNNNISISYCHVHPDFVVKLNQIVKQGSIIGKVGPKYVYDVLNNPYKDNFSKPTNGATTGPHLHITIKKDGKTVNPLDFLTIQN